MMGRSRILAALCLACLTVLSCRERLEPYSDGSSVIFSASTALGSPTKTQYAGGYVADGQKERLNWVSGDGLTILSPQAVFYNKTVTPWTMSRSSDNPAYSVADYAVSGTVTADGVFSNAGIAPSAAGLDWGEGAHHFFGVYPAIGSLPDSIKTGHGAGITTSADRTKGIISAYIPKAQTHAGTRPTVKCAHNNSVDSTYIKPQMQYAWMWSAQYAPEPDKQVNMFFSPMITTFQFAVQGIGDADIPITRFELHSENDALQGEFSATVSVKDGNSVVTRTALSNMLIEYDNSDYDCQTGTNDVVSFTMPAGTVVSETKKVTFTVFVYPRANHGAGNFSGLTVRFYTPGVVRSLKLMYADRNNWVQFPAGKKINIDGLTLPRQEDPWRFTVTDHGLEPEISDVAVDPVQVVDFEYVDAAEPQAKTMTFILKRPATASAQTVHLPFDTNATLRIDWGDGTVDDYPSGADKPGHEYGTLSQETLTEVNVTLYDMDSHSMSYIKSSDFTDNFKTYLKEIRTPLVPGSYYSDYAMAQMFSGYSNLDTICPDLFSNYPELSSFNYTFSDCKQLTSIPEDLFANNPKVTNFAGTFYRCTGLSGSIPAGLFANNPEVTTFLYTFRGCSGLSGSIPAGLFANNPEVTSFDNTFWGCSGLSGSIPVNLFAKNTKVTSFNSTFGSCRNLSGSIPAGLFANNPEVTTFYNTFGSCNNLSGSIPAGLFANNPEVTNFGNTFVHCYNLSGSIPAGLFANNPKVTRFDSTFYGCKNLTGSIPAGLFANKPLVTTYFETFRGCENLEGSIPESLFASSPLVTSFEYTFQECKNLTGSIPAGLFANNPEVKSFACTFYVCSSLSGSIPAGLFENNTKVTSFELTFASCSGLGGAIPSGLFANTPDVTTFYRTFSRCSGLSGSALPLWNNFPSAEGKGCYNDCTGLSDYSTIPDYWKTSAL